MAKCRIAVCDDAAIEREILCTMLHQYAPEQLLFQFSRGEDLLNSHEVFDLVFLDIYMDGMTGMETAKALHRKNENLSIVFLTSSADFAVESYEVQALDYIVKPLQGKRLRIVWERFLAQHQNIPKYLIVNYSGTTGKLSYDQIEFLESDRHYVTIHLSDGTALRIQGKLDDFEHQLDDSRFLRCHKSYLINLRLAEAMHESFLMHSGATVAYRKRDKKQFQRIFSRYASKDILP